MSLHPTERLRPGLQFTERMSGDFFTSVTRESANGNAPRPIERFPLTLTLTVRCEDLARMLREPDHGATFVGVAAAPSLAPGGLLTVTDGRFNLFVVDPERTERRLMCYAGILRSLDGRAWAFSGEKEIWRNAGVGLWSATTTLHTLIYDGPEVDLDHVHGTGILTVSSDDFLQQLTTFRVRNAATLGECVDALTEFGRFFGSVLLDTYGRAFARARLFTPDAPRNAFQRPGPPMEQHEATTDDGVQVKLTRYAGGPRGPVVLAPGFGVSCRSFAIDTVETNLVEYLFARGYDVWLFDYRASPDVWADPSFTIDDIALRDYPAAVQKIRQVTDAPHVQMVVHCVGSMSFLMAMLAGRLDGMVRSAVCSQLALHPITLRINEIKSGLYVASLLRKLGLKTLTADFDEHRWTHWWLDRLLRLYPGQERCNNPICRRVLFLYGESYRHDQLNTATHDAMQAMFASRVGSDRASVRAMEHLSLMVRRRHVVDRHGDNVYLGHANPRLKIPISFMHGRENREFLPQATLSTYEFLCKRNGEGLYRREEFPGYGHMDCFVGRNAARDIFPWIADQLQRF